MSAVMNGPSLKRGGAGNRALHYAFLASLALHASLLLVSPHRKATRETAAPGAIVARLVAPEAPPAASAPVRPELPQPAIEPPKPAPPRPIAKPAPKPAPQAKPIPLPVPQPREAPSSGAPAQEPRPSTPPAEATTLPAPGSGPSAARSDAQATPVAPAADAGSVEKYRVDLISMARRYKRYPRVALDNNWEGRVVVRMVIGANGMIASIQVTASSGHDVLDKQALDMIRKAKPLVPIPAAMRGREFPVEIPVHYNLKDQDSG